jgi:hypothetical protein
MEEGMDWSFLARTEFVAPAAGLVGVLIGSGITAITNLALTRRKFEFDKKLAERKFNDDLALQDYKRRVELAEEVLSGFYRVNYSVRDIRSPFSSANEAQDRPKSNDEAKWVAQQRDRYYPVVARYDAHRQEFADLFARRYRMKALFGRAVDEPFDILRDALEDVIKSAQMLVAWSGDDTQKTDPDIWKAMERKIWWGIEPDPITTKIATATEKIEAICRPILEGTQHEPARSSQRDTPPGT